MIKSVQLTKCKNIQSEHYPLPIDSSEDSIMVVIYHSSSKKLFKNMEPHIGPMARLKRKSACALPLYRCVEWKSQQSLQLIIGFYVVNARVE